MIFEKGELVRVTYKPGGYNLTLGVFQEYVQGEDNFVIIRFGECNVICPLKMAEVVTADIPRIFKRRFACMK